MFDDDVWRYMPLGPVPSLALATVGAAAAIYVAVVRSRATRAIAVAMRVAAVMTVHAYTARGVLSNDDGEFSWRLGESIRAELRNINRSLGLVNVFGKRSVVHAHRLVGRGALYYATDPGRNPLCAVVFDIS